MAALTLPRFKRRVALTTLYISRSHYSRRALATRDLRWEVLLRSCTLRLSYSDQVCCAKFGCLSLSRLPFRVSEITLWTTVHRSLRNAQIFYRTFLSRARRLGVNFLPFRHTGCFRAGHLSQISQLWKIRAALIA